MRHLPIIVKFLVVLALLGVVALGAVGYMAFQLRQTAYNGANIAKTTMQAAFDIANGTEQIQHARADMLSIQITLTDADNNLFYASMQEDLRHFNASMTQAALLAPAHASQIKALQAQGNALFGNLCAHGIQMARAATSVAGDDAAQAEILNDGCLKAFMPYVVTMIAFRNDLIQHANQQYVQLQTNTMSSLILSILVLVLAIIIVIGLAYLMVRKYITYPLGRLGDIMQRLAGGEWSVRVPETDLRDEIGKMAKTLLVFKQAGLEKEQMEAAAKQAQAEIEAERSRNEAIRKVAEAALNVVVNSLASGLERLSSGDLMFRLTENFAEEYEKLRTDFNKAVETLQQTMQRIADNATGVDTSSKEITQGADNMSHRIEQQAASLEQTAAALDEITATVKKSSVGMKEAHELVNKAKIDAERSGEVVNETVAAMSGIEDSSGKISNIISIIDEIAFQTNLLALNAGVEAARAGDAGRGFAVVATEVRALAQRSADAAKEIKALINESGKQVQVGVKLVHETGQSLGRIVDQVARLNILITDVANSAMEQSTALGEVNHAVNQMDQVTQQNAAMIEESTAASHALAREAEGLRLLLGQFRIGQERVKPVSLVKLA